jgi:hypothetical protein
MLSDQSISFAGRSFTITSHELMLLAGAILVCLFLWSAFYVSRKHVVILLRSSGTDQITFELSRIADALERIASQPADKVIESVGQQPQSQPLSERSKSAAYSIFRR